MSTFNVRTAALLVGLAAWATGCTASEPEPATTEYQDEGPNAACERYRPPPASFDTVEVGGAAVPALRGAELDCVDLGGAELEGADLREALLVGARLANARLRGANLEGARLTLADLTGADLRDANLRGALLDRADLTGADLTGADLTGVSATLLVGCPERLPERWLCATGADGLSTLVGPGAQLRGANLEGADLGEAILDGVRATGLLGCPSRLPAGAACTGQAGGRFVIIGRGVNLDGADLRGTALGGLDLTGVHATSLVACPDVLPPEWACLTTSWGAGVLVGPGADLRGAQLSGVNLSGLDLTGADLGGASSFAGGRDLAGCPAVLPESFACVRQRDGRFALVGPEVDASSLDVPGANLGGLALSGVYFVSTNLSFANLAGADLTGAWLTNADFTGADLTGANMQDVADLSGVRATGLAGCPASLPVDWWCAAASDGTHLLVGPDGSLAGVDLSGGVPEAGAGKPLQACPDALPPGWACVKASLHTRLEPAFVVVGPGTVLTPFVLSGVDLTGVDLTGASLFGTMLTDLVACPATLPQSYRCIPGGIVDQTTFVVVGYGLGYPRGLKLAGADLTGLDLRGANLDGADLTGADLTGADLTLGGLHGVDATGAHLAGSTLTAVYGLNLRGCPADLPAGWRCLAYTLPPPFEGLPAFLLAGPTARLRMANLSSTDLAGVDLSAADLSETNMSGLDLTGTKLAGADLSGANLTGTDLSAIDLTGVVWGHTTCPDGANTNDVGGTCAGHLKP